MTKLAIKITIQISLAIFSLLAAIILALNMWDISEDIYIAVGIFAVLFGVIMAGVKDRSWISVFSLIFLGTYLLARGFGLIENQLFRYAISGALGLLAVGIIANLLFNLYKNDQDTNISRKLD